MRIRTALLFLAAGLPLAAQSTAQLNLPGTTTAAQKAAANEQDELAQAVNEAGQSSVDLIREFEAHLKKYPQCEQRADIESALLRSALDTNDHDRIIKYGELFLSRNASEDLNLLDRVARALLDTEDADRAKRAVDYARRYRGILQSKRGKPEGHLTEAQWNDQIDRGVARALALEARATGNTGNLEGAIEIAKRSFDTFPTAEAAREAGRWMVRAGHEAEAVEYYADAFSIEDSRATAVERERDRKTLGEIYTKLHGSEQGLGEVLLAAYDRIDKSNKQRMDGLREKDPNSLATDLFDFTLPALQGDGLKMSSLKGKTIIMDFWATWCQPCRAQHPLIENVKKKFAKNPDVVFLSVNADEDRSLIPDFLKELKWQGPIYYEAGLQVSLRLSSLPTLLVISPDGKVWSRMAGFIPERFEDMLEQRIRESRSCCGSK